MPPCMARTVSNHRGGTCGVVCAVCAVYGSGCGCGRGGVRVPRQHAATRQWVANPTRRAVEGRAPSSDSTAHWHTAGHLCAACEQRAARTRSRTGGSLRGCVHHDTGTCGRCGNLPGALRIAVAGVGCGWWVVLVVAVVVVGCIAGGEVVCGGCAVGGTGMVPVPSCRITPNYVRARAHARLPGASLGRADPLLGLGWGWGTGAGSQAGGGELVVVVNGEARGRGGGNRWWWCSHTPLPCPQPQRGPSTTLALHWCGGWCWRWCWHL